MLAIWIYSNFSPDGVICRLSNLYVNLLLQSVKLKGGPLWVRNNTFCLWRTFINPFRVWHYSTARVNSQFKVFHSWRCEYTKSVLVHPKSGRHLTKFFRQIPLVDLMLKLVHSNAVERAYRTLVHLLPRLCFSELSPLYNILKLLTDHLFRSFNARWA